MSRKWAALEMATAVVLMVVMILCLIRIWRQSEKLLDSMISSADSYKIVVADGKKIFKESHRTIPTHINTLETISGHLKSFIAKCRNTSVVFEKIRVPEPKGFGGLTSWLNSLMRKLGDFAESPIPTTTQIKDSLDACAATLRDIQSKEKHDDICKAFDDTAASLESAKETMGVLKSSLRGVIATFTVIMGICCLGVFCHGLGRWRAITHKVQ